MRPAKPQVIRYEAEKAGDSVTVEGLTPPCLTSLHSILIYLWRALASRASTHPGGLELQPRGHKGLSPGIRERLRGQDQGSFRGFDPGGVSRSDSHVVVRPLHKILTRRRPKPQVRPHFTPVTMCDSQRARVFVRNGDKTVTATVTNGAVA